MWLCTNKAFVSVVRDKVSGTVYLARARRAGHIEELFQGFDVAVFIDENADYKYRAYVTEVELKGAIERAVDEIDYFNFKNSVEDGDLHDAYFRVWLAMNDYQKSEGDGNRWGNRFGYREGRA